MMMSEYTQEEQLQILKYLADSMCNDLMADDHDNASFYNVILTDFDHIEGFSPKQIKANKVTEKGR